MDYAFIMMKQLLLGKHRCTLLVLRQTLVRKTGLTTETDRHTQRGRVYIKQVHNVASAATAV